MEVLLKHKAITLHVVQGVSGRNTSHHLLRTGFTAYKACVLVCCNLALNYSKTDFYLLTKIPASMTDALCLIRKGNITWALLFPFIVHMCGF